MKTLRVFVKEIVKVFLYRVSAGFRESNLKECKETDRPVGQFGRGMHANYEVLFLHSKQYLYPLQGALLLS